MNIGRINVMQICTRSNWYRRGNTKPTLRKRMFTIIPTSTLNTITGALVVAQLIVSNVRISIANSYTILIIWKNAVFKASPHWPSAA